MTTNRLLLDPAQFEAHLDRIAAEIARRNAAEPALMLVGIQAGGVRLAERLASRIERTRGGPVPRGVLDVSMHRDDFGGRSNEMHPTQIPGDVTGQTVILVDDVIFTGRTTRAALDALTGFGRPKRIQLAVMVDRGHRELPIMPDYVGLAIAVPEGERVEVRFAEDADRDEVVAQARST